MQGKLLMVLGVAALLAVVGASVWVTRQIDLSLMNTRGSSPAKVFSTGIMEEVRLRDFQHFGVDLLAFQSCRIEKLRRGAVTFGAFNVLVLDNVTVNLPSETSGIHSAKTSGDADGTDAGKTDTDDFIKLFKSVQGLTGKKFSGVRINGLAVNRWADGKTERLFSADSAEGGIGIGEHIRLEGCVVYSPDGTGEAIGPARIELKPKPALVYKKGNVEQRRVFPEGGLPGNKVLPLPW